MPDWGFIHLQIYRFSLSRQPPIEVMKRWSEYQDFLFTNKVDEDEFVILVQAGSMEAEAHCREPIVDACLDLLFSGQRATFGRYHAENFKPITYVSK